MCYQSIKLSLHILLSVYEHICANSVALTRLKDRFSVMVANTIPDNEIFGIIGTVCDSRKSLKSDSPDGVSDRCMAASVAAAAVRAAW